jgi:FkbM family methyltransferase
MAAVMRVLRWQVGSRLIRGSAVMPFTKRTRLLVKRGMTGATGNIYCGLHDFEDMAFMLHLLRPADTFVDVGANVGTYTVLASGEAGARSIAIEPVPQTFQHLLDNVYLNRLHDCVVVHNCGVGSESGVLRFTATHDTTNHVVAAEEPEPDCPAIKVGVRTLDDILVGESPKLIKIDVEGFESHVIRGAGNVLTAESLSAVVMELNGSGQRYGFDDESIHRQMLAAGFRPYGYDPFGRVLSELPDRNTRGRNTLYLRDMDDIKTRIADAAAIELPWRTI